MAKEIRTASWPDGSRLWEAEFENGVEHGKYRSWHMDGEPWEEGDFVKGKREGMWTMQSNGVVSTLEMRDDVLVHKVERRDGKVIVEEHYGSDGELIESK